MAHTPTEQLTKNVLYAIRVESITQATVARELGISIRTFQRRLNGGRFTMSDLEVIAALTKNSLFDLLPTESVKASA